MTTVYGRTARKQLCKCGGCRHYANPTAPEVFCPVKWGTTSKTASACLYGRKRS